MNAPTDIQIIMENGRPAFAVIPWAEFEAIRPEWERIHKLRTGIPHAVVRRVAVDEAPALRAWMEYLGVSQSELARRSGVAQPTLSLYVSGKRQPRRATLGRLAAALGLTPEQLDI